jgi:hypothetical protein
VAVDLGTRLVREELVLRSDLERALAHAARQGRTLPHALVELGLMSEDGLLRFFRARLPFGEVGRPVLAEVSAAVATQVPREMSEEFGLLAIGRAGDTLSVAMVDPSNGHAVDEVAFFTGCKVMPLVARPSDLDWARPLLYPPAKDTAPLSVPLSMPAVDHDDDDAVLDLVTRRRPQPAPPHPGSNEGGVDVTSVIALTRTKVPTADDWLRPEPERVRDTPVTGWESWEPAAPAADDEGTPVSTEVRPVMRPPAPPANVAPPRPGERAAAVVTGVHEIPPSPRSSAPPAQRAPFDGEPALGSSPATAAPAIAADADLPSLLSRLRRSTDRDEAISLAVTAVAKSCRRAALFVVKKAVAQGWEARGEGVVGGAIRNVWIPVSSPSVLRLAATSLEPYVGPVEDTIANGILMAALGRRVDRVGVWPVVVRERAVAVLYADGFGAEALPRVDEVVHELAQSFERIILDEKARR